MGIKRVIVCDDHQVVLEGLNLILNSVSKITLVAMCQTKQEFQEVQLQSGDVIIVDAQLSKDYNGIQLKSDTPNADDYYWILFSAYVDNYLVYRAESAGFNACLSKEVPSEILIETIFSISEIDFFTYPPINESNKGKSEIENRLTAYQSLTHREKSVMKELTSGNSTKVIAERLHISVFTLETHKKNIFRKFEIKSVAELIRIGVDLRL